MSSKKNSSDDGWLNIFFFSVIIICFFFFVGLPQKNTETAGKENNLVLEAFSFNENLLVYEENSLFVFSPPTHQKPQTVAVTIEAEKLWVELTGYSSTVDQTNCDPFTTASGEQVRDGIVAANFLPFGTKIRIPEAFGDKVFVVKDRMNRRYSPPYDNVWHDGYVDIWFHTREEARQLGRIITYIEIIR